MPACRALPLPLAAVFHRPLSRCHTSTQLLHKVHNHTASQTLSAANVCTTPPALEVCTVHPTCLAQALPPARCHHTLAVAPSPASGHCSTQLKPAWQGPGVLIRCTPTSTHFCHNAKPSQFPQHSPSRLDSMQAGSRMWLTYQPAHALCNTKHPTGC